MCQCAKKPLFTGFLGYDCGMGFQTWILPFFEFADNVLLPVLFGLALLFFFWNLVRYAIIGGANKESRATAKTLMLWGVLALFVMVSIWGIVNLFLDDLGFGGDVDPITPDYMLERQMNADDPCLLDPFGPGCNPVSDPCEVNPNDPSCNPV